VCNKFYVILIKPLSSVLQSFTSLNNPHAFVTEFFAKYAPSTTQLGGQIILPSDPPTSRPEAALLLTLHISSRHHYPRTVMTSAATRKSVENVVMQGYPDRVLA
jgi:hypothetical protein